ncbi:hypothetical protein E2C01_026542 [Portunus trituberculatus]|uniref:Uncharacterized protein n=1 Tax=Portunus trituberculatus TaxID=210409 RepID=A0A5B7EIK7_PORTR|nr:hypothetical protein [Portunus trituberculatus]
MKRVTAVYWILCTERHIKSQTIALFTPVTLRPKPWGPAARGGAVKMQFRSSNVRKVTGRPTVLSNTDNRLISLPLKTRGSRRDGLHGTLMDGRRLECMARKVSLKVTWDTEMTLPIRVLVIYMSSL